uniref:Uncharacterized protein n=1 Tax=Anolis carolinensis TaxID=28377 RepID=A0A803T9D8_ANOCA
WQSKYPEVVLPEGSSGNYMLLRNKQLPGLELMIVWKIRVDEEGNVTPALDLLHKIPQMASLTMTSSKFPASSQPRMSNILSWYFNSEACEIHRWLNLCAQPLNIVLDFPKRTETSSPLIVPWGNKAELL